MTFPSDGRGGFNVEKSLTGTAEYDLVETRSRRVSPRVAHHFTEAGYSIVDVPYDGDCALHAVAPAFARHFVRPVLVEEIRRLLVAAWRHDTRFANELVRELAVEKAAGGLPPSATVEHLLAKFERPQQHLPPILLAEGTETITGEPVKVYAVASARDGPAGLPTLLLLPDRPPSVHILYLESIRHFCRLIKANE